MGPTVQGNMDPLTVISKRHSVRRYTGAAVPKQIVQQVVDAGKGAVSLYPEIGVRWYVVWDGRIITRALGGQAGVHGMFTLAPHYILAVSQERPGYMENLGFRMEQLVLAATALDLGTCWIGGLFTEARLAAFAPDLARDERIVALTPLGYADTSPVTRMAHQVARWASDRSGERKPLPETVSLDTWTVSWTGEDPVLNQILEQVRLAPSWANTQPWHLVVDDQQVVAAVDHTPQQGNLREDKPYYRLDGGIAMCHFYLAAQAAGWPGMWSIPGPEEQLALRRRYAIPAEYDILGAFPLPDHPARLAGEGS